jgi:hypothetical protein
MPEVNGKQYSYTPEGIAAARAASNDMYGPTESRIQTMRYGGFCAKKMPMESNNPRTIQGQKLRRGGVCKKMKQGGYK